MTYFASVQSALFWMAVMNHCFLAAEMDRPVAYSSRIDGLLMPRVSP